MYIYIYIFIYTCIKYIYIHTTLWTFKSPGQPHTAKSRKGHEPSLTSQAPAESSAAVDRSLLRPPRPPARRHDRRHVAGKPSEPGVAQAQRNGRGIAVLKGTTCVAWLEKKQWTNLGVQPAGGSMWIEYHSVWCQQVGIQGFKQFFKCP